MGTLADAVLGVKSPLLADEAIPVQTNPVIHNDVSEIGKGWTRGVGGVTSGLQAAVGQVVQPFHPELGNRIITDATQQAHADQAAFPASVPTWSKVQGLQDAAEYVGGKFGEFLPVLPLAYAGGLAGRAIGGTPLAAQVGGAASFAPQMIGHEAMQLHADPAAARLTPMEKLGYSVPTAVLGAAAGAAVPAAMGGSLLAPQARSLTNALVTRPALNVAGGGAGMAAMDVTSQAGQKLYNPDKNINWEQTKEAAIAGAAGMAPLAAAHAVPEVITSTGARAVDAGIKKAKELDLPKTYEEAKAKLDEVLTARDELAAAPKEGEFNTQKAVADLTVEANKIAAHIKEATKTAGEAIGEGVEAFVGVLKKKAGVAENTHELSRWMLDNYSKGNDRAIGGETYQKSVAHMLSVWSKGKDLGRLKPIIDKVNSGVTLSKMEAVQLWAAAAHASNKEIPYEQVLRDIDELNSLQESTGESRPDLTNAKFSKHDPYHAEVANALMSLRGNRPEVNENILKFIQSGNMKRGATWLARRAMQGSGLKEGSEQYNAYHDAVLEALKSMQKGKQYDEGPSSLFEMGVRMIVDHAMKDKQGDERVASAATGAITDLLHNFATGKANYGSGGKRLVEFLRRQFGEAGEDMADQLRSLVEQEYKNTEISDRMMQDNTALGAVAREMEPLLGSAGKGVGTSKLAMELVSSMRDAQEADLRYNPKKGEQLYIKAREKQEQADNLRAKNPERAAELDAEAQRILEERNNQPLSDTYHMDMLRKNLVKRGVIKSHDSFEPLHALVQRFYRTEYAKTDIEKAQRGEGGSKPVTEDENNPTLHQLEAEKRVTEEGEMSDDAREATAKTAKEEGTDSTSSPYSYYGSTSFNARGELRTTTDSDGKLVASPAAREIGAPLSRYPSKLFADKNGVENSEINSYYDRIQGGDGAGPRIGRIRQIPVKEWAAEIADMQGGGERMRLQLLEEAMDALLKHDAELLKRATGDDKKAIEARQKAAEEGAEHFWNHPYTQHHRYLRVEQRSTENFEFSPENLAYNGPRHPSYNTLKLETPEQYAERMNRRDDGAFGTDQKPYTDSLIDVRVKDGEREEIIKTDMAELVAQAMREHQRGDVSGVEGDRAKQIMNAVVEILSAITTMPETLEIGGSIKPSNKVGKGSKLSGEMSVYINPDLVVYREVQHARDANRAIQREYPEGRREIDARAVANANKMKGYIAPVKGESVTKDSAVVVSVDRKPDGKFYTVRDLTGIMGKDAKGFLEKHGLVMKDGKYEAIFEPPKDVNAFLRPSIGGAKEQGVVRGVVTTPEGRVMAMDMRALLVEAMNSHGLDGNKELHAGDIPDAFAAKMIDSALRVLEAQGYKVDHERLVDAVVKRNIHGETEWDVTWGKLKERLKDKTSTDIAEAREIDRNQRLTNAYETLKEIEAAMKAEQEYENQFSGQPQSAQAKERKLKLDEASTRASKAEIQDTYARHGFSELRVVEREDGSHYLAVNREKQRSFGENDAGLRSDIEVARLNEVLKEAGGKDAALFDRSTNVFSEDAASRAAEASHFSDKRVGEKEAVNPALREKLLGESERKLALVRAAQERIMSELSGKEFDKEGMPVFEEKPSVPGKPVDATMPPVDGAPVTKTLKRPEPAAPDFEALKAKARIEPLKAEKPVATERAEPEKMKLELETPVLDWLKSNIDGAKARARDAAKLPDDMGMIAKEIGAKDGLYSIADANKVLNALTDAQKVKLGEQLFFESGAARNQMVNLLKQRGVKFSEFEGVGGLDHAKAAAELKRLIGENAVELGFTTGDSVGRYEPRIADEKGFTASAAKIMLDSARADTGTLHHETWHHIEEMYKAVGKEGERIIGIVHDAMKTPLMEQWLKAELGKSGKALEQLSDMSERAAFAFQMFMKNGGKMPLVSEVKSIWRRLADWIMEKLHIQSDTQKTENLFKYVAGEELAQNRHNTDAMLRGMKETAPDRFIHSLDKAMKPVKEVANILLTSGEERVREFKNPHYDELIDQIAGKSGKGGYQLSVHQEWSRWGNKFAEKMADTPVEQRSLNQVSKEIGEFSEYMINGIMEGLNTDRKHATKLAARIEKNVDGYNKWAADERFPELVKDLATYGGLPKGLEPKYVATQIADTGHYFNMDFTLFDGHPEIKNKWLSKDAWDKVVAMVSEGTAYTERTRHFGAITKEAPYGERFAAKLAEGDKVASPEAREAMREYIKGWEHDYESNMSPELKKAIGVIQLFENVRLLPLAVFSQALEPMQLAFRKNSFDGVLDTTFRGIKNLPRAFDTAEKYYTPDHWENLAMQIGTAQHRILHGAVSHMVNGMKMRGRVGWLNDKFFQYNFMNTWNNSMHIEATKHAVEFLREHSKGISEKHSERFLRELNLTKEDVLKTIVGDSIDLTKDTNHKVEKAIVQFVNEAMAHPDAGSNPFWMNDPRFALVAQMKRFTFAHAKFVLDRGAKEFEQGNTWVLAPAALAIPWMLASDSIRDTLVGKDMSYRNNWGVSDYLMHGFERAGHAGKNQLGVDIWRDVQMGGTGLGAALGPAAENFGSLMRGANHGDLIDGLIGGTPSDRLLQ